MANSSVPTLEELLDKYRALITDESMKQFEASFLCMLHGVASGESQSILTGQSAQAAAQTVLVIYHHVKNEMN
jgi:hypothetical protein